MRQRIFEFEILTYVTCVEWWRSQSEGTYSRNNVLTIVVQFVTVITPSASVEKFFSTSGSVQSKLRNRLGAQKTANLIFLYKLFYSGADSDDFRFHKS